MDLRQTISSSNNWLDLKAKIDACFNTKHKGDIFELLTKLYLQIDPRYVSKLTTVWLYNEIPTNTLKKLNLPTKDMGIDLIAETNEGEYWAIQCKYKADESKSLTWREISTFQSLAFSKAKGISFGLVATTVDRSANVFKDQKEDVKLLAGEVWRDLDVEFFKQAKKLLAQKIVRPIPFQPRKHQQRAVSHAYQHFVLEKATRGKMIMPCGTGKSLTSYWIAKELEAKTVVIAVPSLSLINQTLKAWLREVIANMQTVDWIAICSDKTAGEVDSAISTQDLGIPTNTDPEIIAKWLRKRSPDLKVVFTTYQSGKVLAEASRLAKKVFDLGIMDEAHKTVGDRDKTFAHLLSDENIKIRKRVFMTATERRYAGNRDEIISMDNPEVYGDTFELLTFKEALEQDPPILSDYKILTMLIDKEEVVKYIQERAIVKPDRGKWDDGVQAEMLAGIVALNQAMEKYPIKHAVSFHTSIAKAQAFRNNQQTYTEAVEKGNDQVETFFVSGKTPTSIRSRIIKEFASSDRALISNARCLTEGVDVPNIDGVLFADPKRSAVDIVQAVGRALRLADGKDFGYIIIPVLIEDETGFENSGAFQTILTVLRALASNDERIVEYFRDRADKKQSTDLRFTPELTESLLERIDLDQFVKSIELQVWNRLAKLNWRPFEEARNYVRSLGLKNLAEWRLYQKSGQKPDDIPSTPARSYQGRGWINLGDWLGTGTIAAQLIKFRSFEKARDFARSLELKSVRAWQQFCVNAQKPDDIPSNAYTTYKDEGWISWADFLGFAYKPFEEAREFARSLGLKNGNDWKVFCKSGLKPPNIPISPREVYKHKGWIGIGDWLGTGSVSTQFRKYRTFESAREFVISLGLKSQSEWNLYCKSGQKPDDIPISLSHVYKDEGWISWADFLGYSFRSFVEAREFVISLGLKSQSEWNLYCKSGQKPDDIPSGPNQAYKSEWLGYGDWLGTGNIANHQMEFLEFSIARKIVRKLKIPSATSWMSYCKGKSKHLPIKQDDIPARPDITYRHSGWVDWSDWLGLKEQGIVRNSARQLIGKRGFKKSRLFAQSLKLNSAAEWRQYCKGALTDYPSLPDDIPHNPHVSYKKDGWVSWGDWLGTGRDAPGSINFMEYENAKRFVHKLKLDSYPEWNKYIKGTFSNLPQLPANIPKNPLQYYKKQGEWVSVSDWLGTKNIADIDKRGLFPSANGFKRMMKTEKISTAKQYRIYYTKKKNNLEELLIPHDPVSYYKEFNSWGDISGVYHVRHLEKLSFKDARSFVHKLSLKSRNDWRFFCKGGLANLPERPPNLPTKPEVAYKDQGWKGWPDFLGY